ncbi:MAG: hypothetical protein IKB34_03210 [Clostridia bacterium]|nr:hypothetical protein [Clostridia bacterium]
MLDVKNDLFAFELNEQKEESVEPNDTSFPPIAARYIVRELPKEVSEKQDVILSEPDQKIESSKIPFWMNLTMTICASLAAMIFLITLRALSDKLTLSQMYSNAGYFLWPIMLFLGAVALVIFLKKRSLSLSVTESPDFKDIVASTERIINESKRLLSVPESADEVDILMYAYTVNKNGKIKASNPLFSHFTMSFNVFRENDCICLANTESVLAFPLSEITSILKIDQKVSLSLDSWTKNESPISKKYKPFKLTVYNGIIYSKYYYAVTLSHDGEQLYFTVPCYDIEPFTGITGIQPTEITK